MKRTLGFAPIVILIVVAALAAGTGLLFYAKNKKSAEVHEENGNITLSVNEASSSVPNLYQTPNNPSLISSKAFCPDPFVFDLPIDINKATSVLYPGQVRGGDFKAHGGFRFDNSRPEEIIVTAPIDAPVVVGARYPVNGIIQYTMEFEHPCGVRYRLGHLLTLAPKFQALAETLPLPQTLDSRTNAVVQTDVKKGEVVATAVGLPGNTFLDWGVYDYRQENEVSKDPIWRASHTSDTYRYGVCWFDWISPENRVKVLALPSADGVSGKQSDFCK
ncbi:MAG: hypothetical protein HYT69_02590 [Candidatus Zambryskibacteria bacterium]|nr:hypothetical protein [Candidatus Zambryskibacteria bacterium]